MSYNFRPPNTYVDGIEHLELGISENNERGKLIHELYALVDIEAKIPPSGELFADRVRAADVPDDHVEKFMQIMKKHDVPRAYGAFSRGNSLVLVVTRDGQAIREWKNKQRWQELRR